MSLFKQNQKENLFSSQLTGERFLTFVKTYHGNSKILNDIIDFITSNVYISNYGPFPVLKLVSDLFKDYKSYITVINYIIKKLINTPCMTRLVDMLEDIPNDFYDNLPLDIKESVLDAFSNSVNRKIRESTYLYLRPKSLKPKESKINIPSVSLADVFNENAQSNNLGKAIQFIERFQNNPFTVYDVADFISNLASDQSPIYNILVTSQQGNKQPNVSINVSSTTISQLLRPFNSAKMETEELIHAFDKNSTNIQNPPVFPLFLACLKEVLNVKSIPLAPFLGKWNHPSVQLNLITSIVSAGVPLTYPKPQQLSKISSFTIGDIKADYWRCVEFVETLAYLYDFFPNKIDEILGNVEKGFPLLLIVLSQTGKVSKFATHLTKLLFNSPTQYMPGFSAIWAANRQFLVDLITNLNEEQHSLLGYFTDLIDDLSIFDEFMEIAPLKIKILIYISSFFRHGFNFMPSLKELYSKDKETLQICISIFDNPIEFGLYVPMKTEYKISNDETVSADYLFFKFVNDIFSQLEQGFRQRINILFDKCLLRTPKLINYTFKWRTNVKPPQPQKTTQPATEIEYLKFAVTPNSKHIAKYQLYVQSILSEFPKDKNTAQKNGQSCGILLAHDLLNLQDTSTALSLINKGLSMRENSNGFIYASSAINELKDHFDLYIPFAQYILSNPQFKKSIPNAYESITKTLEEKDVYIDVQPQEKVNLKLHPRFKRFKYISHSIKNISPELIAKNPNKMDQYSLIYINNEMISQQRNSLRYSQAFYNNCIEAALYKVHEIVLSPSVRSNDSKCFLIRLGKWLGYQTLNKSIPIFSSYLDIQELLLYGYTNNALMPILYFVQSLLINSSYVFMPPNPWTISILSILSAFIRIPYLKTSLYYLITSIFEHFNLQLNDIEPYPLLPLNPNELYENDFDYPPIDFISSVPKSIRPKVLDLEISSLFNVVNCFYIDNTREQIVRSKCIMEIIHFIYLKVSSISQTASNTAIELTLKDFARSYDSEAVKRHAYALIHQLINSLSMMSVSMLCDFKGANEEGIIIKESISMNSKWIDLLIRQLSFRISQKIVKKKLNSVGKLRNNNIQFWDVKSFPPSIALKIPTELWPDSIKQSVYTRNFNENSIVATGIYECFNVEPSLKKAYLGFSLEPLSIVPKRVNLPIIPQLASFIYSCFKTDAYGEVIEYRKTKSNISFQNYNPINIIATLIYCFPPQRSLSIASFGVELLNLLNIPTEQKGIIQAKLYQILSSQMPHLLLFSEMVKLDLVNLSILDSLLMDYIDSPQSRGTDFTPLITLLHDLIIVYQVIYPNSIERLLHFICTYNFKEKTEQYQKLVCIWQSFIKIEPCVFIKPMYVENGVKFLNGWIKIKNDPKLKVYILSNQQLLSKDGAWESIILSTFPNDKNLLLRVFYSVLCFTTPSDNIFQSFLRAIYSLAKSFKISIEFFSSVMANVVLNLRDCGETQDFKSLFGGYLNDIKPEQQPIFIGAWIYLFPIIMQSLVYDKDKRYPTSRLFCILFMILNHFPENWGQFPEYRKIYKSIIRATLIIVHDVPGFVSGYYFDFICLIPLRFRRLRNIILSCATPGKSTIIYSSFLKNRKEYENLFSNSYNIHEAMKMLIFSGKNDNEFMFEIGKIILYLYHSSQKEIDETNINSHPLWQLVNFLFMGCYTSKYAALIVEILFDQIRFDSPITRSFILIVYFLFNVKLKWENISIQEIIVSILIQRTKGIQTPEGLQLLHEKLEENENFNIYFNKY